MSDLAERLIDAYETTTTKGGINKLVTDIDVDSILSAYADTLNEQITSDAVREATEFGTVPSGTYLATVTKKEWRETYPVVQRDLEADPAAGASDAGAPGPGGPGGAGAWCSPTSRRSPAASPTATLTICQGCGARSRPSMRRRSAT